MIKKPNKLDVSIIIVSYNTVELTLKCLESIYEETSEISFEIILVDNSSVDGSAQAVEKNFPEVKVIALDKNVGFAQANNLAAGHATGNFLLLLNPDTVILDDAINVLWAFAKQRPWAGIWTGRTIFLDGSLNPTSCYQMMTPWSLFCRAWGLANLFSNSEFFNRESFGSWKYDSVRNVDITTGCFMLVEATLWKILRGFSPLFFMYGEEVDFCLRAKKLGFNPIFTPEAEILHHGDASEPVKASRWEKVFRAKSTLIRKHWSPKDAAFGIKMLLIWVTGRVAIYSILGAIAPHEFGSQKEKWLRLWRGRKDWQLGYQNTNVKSI